MVDERTPVQQEIDASLDPERLAVHQANRAIHAPSPADVPDPRFRDQLRAALIADLPGAYPWHEIVDRWLAPGGAIAAEVQARVQAAANQRAAEAWDRGYAAGHSNAMRRMSDEPNAPTSRNPYDARAAALDTEGKDHG